MYVDIVQKKQNKKVTKYHLWNGDQCKVLLRQKQKRRSVEPEKQSSDCEARSSVVCLPETRRCLWREKNKKKIIIPEVLISKQ